MKRSKGFQYSYRGSGFNQWQQMCGIKMRRNDKWVRGLETYEEKMKESEETPEKSVQIYACACFVYVYVCQSICSVCVWICVRGGFKKFWNNWTKMCKVQTHYLLLDKLHFTPQIIHQWTLKKCAQQVSKTPKYLSFTSSKVWLWKPKVVIFVRSQLLSLKLFLAYKIDLISLCIHLWIA